MILVPSSSLPHAPFTLPNGATEMTAIITITEQNQTEWKFLHLSDCQAHFAMRCYISIFSNIGFKKAIATTVVYAAVNATVTTPSLPPPPLPPPPAHKGMKNKKKKTAFNHNHTLQHSSYITNTSTEQENRVNRYCFRTWHLKRNAASIFPEKGKQLVSTQLL